ncbi:MAG: enoyl-CoA hydratase/isomerase family protein [Candidatus Kapaibacteriales bacterium]
MSEDLKGGSVEYRTEGKVGRIIFGHPQSNSLPGAVLRKLAKTIEEAGKDSTRVLILESLGDRAFCAGASFDELVAIEDFDTGKRFFMGFALVINAMRKCPKFIIAKVQGKAVGGGVGLLSAADYTYGTEFSSVKLSELALGIGPFVVGPAVERKSSTSVFSQMSIDFDWYAPEWALDSGLYQAIFTSKEVLDEETDKLASRLSEQSPEAMAELKRVLWRGTEDWDELLEQRAEISGRLVLSEFTKDYIKQFKSK